MITGEDRPAPTLDSLGERVWLVLGGGGLRGLAHVGVWRAVEETGIAVSGIVGCSVGALVGALIAGGAGADELTQLALALRRRDIARINRRAAWINGIRQQALFHGEPLQTYIESVLPVREWDRLRLPLQVNAVDFETGFTEWFGPGARTDVSLADAVYASTALPVFYPPAVLDGRVYVDGGTEHSLPLHRAAEMGASGVLAVDVGSGRERRPPNVIADGMLAIHERVFSLMSWRKRTEAVALWDGPPLLLVRPRLEAYGAFAFEEAETFLEEGYRAAGEAFGRKDGPDGVS